MPEGDMIFRTARTLHRALAGQMVTGFESVLPRLTRVDFDSAVTGRTVEKVEAQGKWLLMYFSGGQRVTPISPLGFVVGTAGAAILLFFHRLLGGYFFTEQGEGMGPRYASGYRRRRRLPTVYEE